MTVINIQYRVKEVLALFFLTLTFGCGKDKVDTLVFYEDTATMHINNIEHEVEPRLSRNYRNGKQYNLALSYYIHDDVLRKEVHLIRLIEEYDKQNLNLFTKQDTTSLQASYYTLLPDGDIAGNFYNLIETDSITDFIELTKISKDNGSIEFEGNFQASFIIDSTVRFDPESPDTIIIKNGYFKTMLKE